MKDSRKKVIWSLVLLALIGLTLYTVIGTNESFTIKGFARYVSAAKGQWIAAAFLCMLGFILFEAMAIRELSKAFGYRRRLRKCLIYSTSDIYFSAITPSATGGQPASALFMMRDKIPGAVTTIVLLLNLTLYTASIILIGVVCFITRPGMFLHFSILSKCMILAGFLVQFVLLSVFLLLVYKEKIIMKSADFFMRLLQKLHLMHNIEKKQQHLIEVEHQYKECALAIKGKLKNIVVAFIFNLLQRLSLILVSVCVFIAVGGSAENVYSAFVAQGFVVLGSNSVPIPGAVGAADYLFIDGFGKIINDSVSIELLSRGISFYCCIIVCGIITLAASVLHSLKGMKRKKRC